MTERLAGEPPLLLPDYETRSITYVAGVFVAAMLLLVTIVIVRTR